MTSFEDLEKKVVQWAKDRSIFDQSNIKDQFCKLQEEQTELASAILRNDNVDIVDAIGDMMVVLTMIAHIIDYNLFTCYAVAYAEIKDRKGTMVNGLFVKE